MRLCLFIIVLIAAHSVHSQVSSAQGFDKGPESNVGGDAIGTIRTSADGGGPTHIFWLDGPASKQPGRDIIAVVDPLYAAVRLFSLERLTSDVNKLSARFSFLGACALPLTLRPWRIHQAKLGVYIETMPDPGVSGHKVKAAALRSIYYLIKRDIKLDSLATDEQINSLSWDPSKAPQCGVIAGKSLAVRDRQPYTASRGAKNPSRTIILKNSGASILPSAPLIVRSPQQGAFRLYSARELEPVGARRIVQITEGQASDDGLLRLSQHVLTYAGGKVIADRRFDESLVKSKLGQRPLAVTPGGELLAMGLKRVAGEDKARFQIISCGLVDATLVVGEGFLCSNDNDAVSARNIADDMTVISDSQSEDQIPNLGKPTLSNDDTIFDRTKTVRTVEWSVNAAMLPEKCRIASGCAVHGGNYVPIHGIRLSYGIYNQTGMAYAQTGDVENSISRFLQYDVDDWSSSLRNLGTPDVFTPGNLDDDFSNDLGIDCSALVQLAWDGGKLSGRLDTARLQTKPPGYVCPHRISEPGRLRPGDAIAINITDGPHHVVLLGESVQIDGASDSWLVLESASSCGGVCWSVYDPAFFNGWGMYRSSNRSDYKCPPSTVQTDIVAHPIPLTNAAWRSAVQTSLINPEKIERKFKADSVLVLSFSLN